MTQYLGIITAYGAAAILAWLAALLYPRLIPAAADYRIDNRWQQAGLFALATLVSFGIGSWQRQGLLLPDGNPLFGILSQLLILSPILAYIASRRSRAAALVPQRNVLRSLAIGIVLALLALGAYFSTTSGWGDVPAMVDSLAFGADAEILVRTLLQSFAVAAFLALLAAGWSKRVALGLAALFILAIHVPPLLSNGFSAEWLVAILVHLAIGLGIFSAILATRNIVWFWPVFAMLSLLQIHEV